MSHLENDIILRSIDIMNFLKWSDYAKEDEVFHIASYEDIKDSQPELHTHDFAEIFWITDGEGFQIGQSEEHFICRGNMSIVAPEVIHRFSTKAHMTLVNIAFPSRIFEVLTLLYPSFKMIFQAELPARFDLTESGLIELNRALNQLINAPNETEYLMRFISRCMCAIKPETKEFPVQTPDWLKKAYLRMSEPENARKGVKRFVDLAGCSPEHVSRTTKQWLGVTPREIVQEARLALMAKELTITEKPIIEISLDAGFENLGHCYKLFKSKFGVPPATYRKKQKRLPAGINTFSSKE